MIESIALILILGLLCRHIFLRLNLPSLIGMILVGIAIGPWGLNLLNAQFLQFSPEIRKMALIVILIRAGLKLSFSELRQVGRPAILLSFLPASFGIIGISILAPIILGVSHSTALLLGTVVAAVSPAVVVPRMIKLIDQGIGNDKKIPQMILAGASVDDVFVIVLFTSMVSIQSGGNLNGLVFMQIPISIFLGIIVGYIFGLLIAKFLAARIFSRLEQVVIIISVSFTLTLIEKYYSSILPFASLLAVMSLGMAIHEKKPHLAKPLAYQFDQLWSVADSFLFILVGAAVAINHLGEISFKTIILLSLVLTLRAVGVFLSLMKTPLNANEKIFCIIAYLPKATVQAAIGGIPLAMGLEGGQLILSVSVMAILLTAPLGAWLMDALYLKLLEREKL